MKKLAFGALFVGLLVACGGGDEKNNIKIVDGSTVDDIGVCNPLTQAGCATGEKCTWLMDALMPQYVGHVGCAPDGTAAAGDSCMFGAPGASGYDNCAKGTVCGNYRGGTGTCKTVCDQQGGTPMCDASHVCVTYSGLFSTGDTTPASGGVCDLACNPLEDNDFDGSGSDAKGSNVCGSAASVGCYGYPSYGTPPATGWSCTNDINFEQSQPIGLRHRVECTEANNCADPGPTIYVNSCNQGYLPLLYEKTGSTTIICVAMCKPAVCYMGNCGTGSPPANRQGVAPHKCTATNRVVGPNVTSMATEHCQYMWWREVDDSGNFLQSATSDSLGICFDMKQYSYDSNGDNKVDTSDDQLPNCDTLVGSGFGSGSDPATASTYFGAADLGCVSSDYLPAAANGKKSIPAESMRKRTLTNLPRALYRRQMGQ
jgi:hypothetical protein